jgi:hypothetical protein
MVCRRGGASAASVGAFKMFIEWFEAVLSVLSFIFVAPSAYGWHRGETLPSVPEPPLMLDLQSRWHALSGLSASLALFLLGLLMITEVFEAITGV